MKAGTAPIVASSGEASATFSSPTASASASLTEPGRLHLTQRKTPLGITIHAPFGAGAAAEIGGGNLLFRPSSGAPAYAVHFTEDGIEDYAVFANAPPLPKVVYRIDLETVAGLRLVGGTLEFLDATGTPRLRMASPSLFDSAGHVRNATVSVGGCAVDADPRPPEGRPLTNPGAGTCAIEMTWDPNGVAYPLLLDPTWSTTSSMAVARQLFAMALLDDGRALATGGIDANGYATLAAEIYDPFAKAWTTVAPMGLARDGHTATTLLDGTVLVAGGENAAADGVLGNAEVFSPSTGRWTPTIVIEPPQTIHYGLNDGRYLHTATLLSDGRVLFAGGSTYSGSGGLRSVVRSGEIFDPSTLRFTYTQPPIVPRTFAAATRLPDGLVLLAGGYADPGPPTMSSELYDPDLDFFFAVGNMTQARAEHTLTVLPTGKVLAAGGVADGGEEVSLQSAELFSEDGNAWTTTQPMQFKRAGHTATSAESRIIVASGYDTFDSTTPTTESFEAYSETWARQNDVHVGRYWASAVPIFGDRVFVAGGGDAPGFQSQQSAEMWSDENEYIEFYTNNQLITRKFTSAHISETGFGPTPVSPMPLFGLTSAADLTLRFHSDHFGADGGTSEALLFARDPQEMFNTLTGLLNDQATWTQQFDADHMPAALGVPFPDAFADDYSTSPVLTTTTFWDSATPMGPAANPGGVSSVKALFTYENGPCVGGDTPMQEVVDQVGANLWARYVQSIRSLGDLGDCIDIHRAWLYANSFVTELDGAYPDIDPQGGFFINLFFQNKIPVIFAQDQNIHFTGSYRLMVGADGVVTAKPELWGSDFSGTGSDEVGKDFKDAMENAVPQALHDIAAARQWLEVTDANHPPVTCTQDNPNDPSITVGSTTCGGLEARVLGLINQGAAALNVGGDEQTLDNTVLASTNGVYKNFRCIADSRSLSGYLCQYFTPVERVIVFPDELRAILFDRPDPTNGGYASYVASVGAGQPACKPPLHGTDAAYRRYYVTNFAGDLTDASPDAGATCNALLQWDLMTSAYANYVVPVYWDSTPYGTTEWMWGHL